MKVSKYFLAIGCLITGSSNRFFVICWVSASTEQQEVYADIAATLQEARMHGEIVVLAVFEYEDSLLVGQIAVEHEWKSRAIT